MFGGANDTAAAAPAADNQNEPLHDGTLDDASHSAVPADAPMAGGYTGGTYGDTGATAGPADTAAVPAATDDAVAAPAAETPQADPVAAEGGDDLLSIKQQALQQLSPLVGHLDQSPEEKFRTTMMMIQASDNADLIKNAYEAAQQIPDEKVRAQALLDVVNEINYFTQHSEQQQ